MIKRHERTSIPCLHGSRVLSQRKFMILNKFESLKSDIPKRRDDRRIDQTENARQVSRTILDLSSRRPAISVGRRPWAAHHRRSDKYIVPAQTDRIQQSLEILSRLVAIKRPPRTVSTDSSRSLANEKHLWCQRAI